MHPIEIVFMYKAPCTCSGQLCGKEVKGDTFIVLLYKCII